jgi:hypothetical protein
MSTDLDQFDGDLALLSDDQKKALRSLYAQLNPQTEGIEDDEDSEGASITIPHLKIKQAMTRDPGCPADCQEGDLYVTGRRLENPLKVVPIYMWTSNVMFEEDSGASGTECYSLDAKTGSLYGKCTECDHKPWRGGQRQRCMRTLNAIVLLQDLSGIAHVRFSKTSEPAGKMMRNLAKASGGLWNSVLFLKSVSRQSGRNSYFVYDCSTTGTQTDDGSREVAKNLSRQYGAARKDFVGGWTTRMDDRFQALEAPPTLAVGGSDEAVPIVEISGGDPSFDDAL